MDINVRVPRNPFESPRGGSTRSICSQPVRALKPVRSHRSVPIVAPSQEFVALDMSKIGVDCESDVRGKIGGATSVSTLDSKVSTYSLSARALELSKREEQLIAKERAFADKTSQNGEKEAFEEKEEANWPHAKCAYVRHDIDADIPSELQSLVRMGYRTWKLSTAGYVANLLTIALAAFHDGYYEGGLAKSQAVFTAMLWVGVIVPVGFLLWYSSLYRLAQRFSTKTWLLFCVTFAIHLLFTVVILLGTPWYPCAGAFFLMTCFFSGYAVSTVCAAVNCAIWALTLGLSLALFKRVRKMFGGNAGNVQTEVQGELTNAVAKIAAFGV